MNLKDIATELSALTVIKDAVVEATNELRELAKQELTNVGADMTKAIVDNQEVAKITLVTRDAAYVITDEKAFIEWIKLNFATELELKVRESFRKKLFETLAHTPEKQIFTTLTGEVLPFMGIDYKEPYVSTRFSSGGREIVVAAIKEGRAPSLPGLHFYMDYKKIKEIE